MTEQSTPRNAPRKRHGIIRWLLAVFAILAVLLVGAYFMIGSNIFLQRVVLPRIENQTGADINLAEIHWSPLTGLKAAALSVVAKDGTTFSADDINVRYRPTAFLGGGFDVQSIQVDNWSLTRVIPPAPDSDEAPATIQIVNGNILVSNLKSGGRGTIEITGNIQLDKEPDLIVETASFSLTGELALTKAPDIQPTSVNFDFVLDNVEGRAAGTPLDSTRATASISLNPKENSPDTLQIESFTASLADAAGKLLDLAVDGIVNPKTGAITINYKLDGPNHRLLNTVGEIVGDWSFGTVDIKATGTVERSENGAVLATGQSSFNQLQLRNARRGVDRAPRMAGDMEFNLELKPQDKMATIEHLNVAIRQFNDEPLLDIHLDAPAIINWSENDGAVPDQSAKLTATLTNFDLTLLNLARSDDAAAKVNILQGVAAINLTAEIQGGNVTVDGTSSVQNLNIETPKRTLDNLRIDKKFDAEIKDMTSLTAHAVATTSMGQAQVMKTESNTTFDIKNRTGIATFEIVEMNKNVFDLFIPEDQRTIIVESVDISGKATVDFNLPEQSFTLAATFALADFVALDPENGMIPAVETKLSINANIDKQTLNIDNLSLVAQNAAETPVDASVDGVILLPNAHEGSLVTVSSKSLDLDTLQKTANIIRRLVIPTKDQSAAPIETADSGEQQPTPVKAKKEEVEPRNLHVQLALENVTFNQIAIDKATGSLVVSDNKIQIDNVVATLQDGSINLNGFAYLPTADAAGSLSLTADFQNIDIQPFTTNFVSPNFAKQVRGTLSSGRLTAQSDTLKPEDVKNAIQAEIEAQVDSLAIEEADWLRQLSQGLGMPELKTLLFNQGTLNATVANGVVDVQRLRLIGEQVQLRTTGQAELGGDINLETGMAFGGSLLNKIARGELGQQMIKLTDEFKQLPALLKTTGMTQNPNVDVTRFLKELALVTGREALRDEIRKRIDLDDEQLDEGLNLLEGILRGGSEQTTQPVDEPSKPNTSESTSAEEERRKRRDLIRGLIDDATK